MLEIFKAQCTGTEDIVENGKEQLGAKERIRTKALKIHCTKTPLL